MKAVRRTGPESARTNPQGRCSFCYWSVADGEFASMAETMVASARKAGVATEFHIWSDREIAGAIVHPVTGFEKSNYLFKLRFLRDRVTALPHDYFVWLDADNYFVRDPGNILRVLEGAPVHASLESDLCGPNNIRTDWRDCPLPICAHLMRSAGVRGKSIFNVNAGFWIVHRETIRKFCELAFGFWEMCRQRGYLFTEEAPIAYATQMLCRDPGAHQLRRCADVWVTEWRGVYGKRLPDGKPWIFKDYFSFEEFEVNPAIVHAVASKELMIAEAQKQRLRDGTPATGAAQAQRGTKPFKPAPKRYGTTGQSAAGSRRPEIR